MENIVLKAEILEKIRGNATLFGLVSDALKVGPLSLPRLLRENDPRLTQANVLNILSIHLDVQDTADLLETQAISQI